jgi:tetratricopeptide (TPR) repeat protein/predicted Ser/Thr protein kinase
MFGDQSAAGAIGRFRVLERLGAGGMGVVYEAYDPDLARGVALKLVNVAVKDRETALAEAKALARLSHPNVVPIYDVGLESDRVYLVMELVRGKTLRLWPEGRKLCEILDMYQQAGRALAAAHDAGLVHRDFKPDNAIVGADGRVRVVDFGLACEADDPERATSEPRRAAGTPRFMAPEIKAGTATTPAADQYSFCVALADALERASEPTPRRIAVVLECGRAAEPANRFASMGDLLRALARDPAKTWRRVTAVGGLVAFIGAIAFFAGRQTPSEADVCDDGAARLEAAWTRTARSTALDRLATLSPYGQSLRPRLEHDLDTHDRHWVSEYRAACDDRRRRAETDTMSDRRATCLQSGSDALAAVGELIGHAEPANLIELPRAVQSMPDPTACSDRRALTSDIAPPPPALATPVALVRTQITQARVHIGAGRYEQALAESGAAVADARKLGYGPTLAEALLVQGHARTKLVGREAAVPMLEEATSVAISAHADAIAVEAWARRAWVQGTSTDPDGALAGVGMLEAFAQRTPSAGFARALLYNNIGSVELGQGHRDKAREYFERALPESRKVTDNGALELVAIRANIGISTDDRVHGDKLLVEAAAELTARLGADHPDTLFIRRQRGFVTIEDLRTAEQLLTPVCRAYELHATLVDDVAMCWTEVGLVRSDLGDRDGAIEVLERAVHAASDATDAAAYIALLRGDLRVAARKFGDAVAAEPPQQKEPPWKRASRAALTLGLGRARLDMGDLRGAREALERTIADLVPIVREHPGACYERRLGRAYVELAFTLASIGASSAERTPVVTAAAAWLRRVGGSPSEITRLGE